MKYSSTMKKNQIFIAGRVSKKKQQLAQLYDVNTVDILEREDMAVLNAIPKLRGPYRLPWRKWL
jgi:dipicolinate synthase subunit A